MNIRNTSKAIPLDGGHAGRLNERTLATLVNDIAERLRRDPLADVDSLITQHPAHRDELKELLPSIRTLVELGASACLDGFPNDVQVDETQLRELGDFRILRELGRGGMGVVYEAEQISLARRVALKVLPFAALLDQRCLERFRNEARAAAMLKHPNIVSVYSIGTERAVHFYAMELIDGTSLDAMTQISLRTSQGRSADVAHRHCDSDTSPIAALSTAHSTDRKSYYRMVARLISQAADALEYAHQQGVIHRDVKPSNILLDQDGQSHVADFGLAQIRTDEKLTVSGDAVGTLRYMSPEQLDGHVVDERTDIYSLGITLYELLTLCPAYSLSNRLNLVRRVAESEPRDPRSVDAAIPTDLETIVLKAIAKQPNERYATMRALADDLNAFLALRPIRAKKPTAIQRISKWLSRNAAVAWFTAVCLLVVLSITAGAWHRGGSLLRLVEQERIRADAKSDALQHLIGDVLLSTSYQLRHQADSDILRSQLDHAVAAFEKLERDHPDDRSKLVLARLFARRAHNSWGRGQDPSSDIDRAFRILQRVADCPRNDVGLQRASLDTYQVKLKYLSSNLRFSECLQVYEAISSLGDQARVRSDSASYRSWHCGNHTFYLRAAGRLPDAEVVGNLAVDYAVAAQREAGISACSLQARYQLLLTLLELGRWDEIPALADRLLQLSRDLPASHQADQPFNEYWRTVSDSAFAAVANYRYQPGSAVDLLTAAIARATEYCDAHPSHVWWNRTLAACKVQLSDSYIMQGNVSEAESLLVDAIRHSDHTDAAWDRFDRAKAQYRLALLYSSTGRVQDARRHFDAAVAQFESIYMTRLSEVYCSRPLLASLTLPPFSESRDAGEALSIVSRQQDQESALDLRYVALAHHQAGHHQKATVAINKCIAVRNEGDLIDWLIASLIMLRAGDRPQANEYYQKAKKAIQARAPVVFGVAGPLVVGVLAEQAAQAFRDAPHHSDG